MVGVAILVLAVFLRTYNIFSIPIFADEAIYIRWAQVMRAEPGLRFLPLSDGKQPLFMWFVIPFLKVFQDPLVSGRLVSVAAGIATILGIFLLTERLFHSRKTALLGALFYAISPFSVFFDRMALADSMLTAFGIWSLYFGILTSQTLRLDFAMLTGFSLGAAWLTKSPAIFFLLLLPTTLVVSSWPQPKAGRPLDGKVLHLIKLLALWAVSWIIAVVIYNILRLGPNFHMVALRNKDYIFPLSHFLTNPLDPLQFHLKEIIEWFWVLLPATVLIGAVVGVLRRGRRFWREFLVLALWVIFPLLVQGELAKVFTARYILFTIPPIFALAAVGFEGLTQKIKNSSYWILLILFALPSLWIDYLLLTKPEEAPLPRVERSGYLEEWTAGTGIREVAVFLRAEHNRNPDKTIVVGTEGFFGTLPDGLQIYLTNIPGIIVKGVGVSISTVDSSLIEAKKAGDKVFLVVNSSRFEGKAENLGLKLLAAYPKAERAKRTREFVVHGPRESLYLFEVTDDAIDIFNVKNP
ncbi:MAG: glycosyltransferase family 39 protein [Candidatus Blackburnbacteria bacterium]|nr:glycosyltransferase family 39 protein [Candidatus Blackburnbacteria bacterium]